MYRMPPALILLSLYASWPELFAVRKVRDRITTGSRPIRGSIAGIFRISRSSVRERGMEQPSRSGRGSDMGKV
ncbi:hypothetical protein CP970_37145 [Streptomyces kanamyceticus]|uniref:Uncharacterized protein n=1 Tax=Streptomyces kanamyceticus TaxID=1967 RepID=A0A5J6GNZ2_STRKN|nr:hypothetical protein CP970_37145 [Streptomyces kanamyceticus]